MGKLYQVTWNCYSDTGFTNLLGSVSGYFGIAESWDGASDGLDPLANNYNFFTDHLINQSEAIYLGRSYIDRSDQTLAFDPSQWMPLSNAINSDLAGYFEIVFSNGSKIRCLQYYPSGSLASPRAVELIDSGGVSTALDIFNQEFASILPYGGTNAYGYSNGRMGIVGIFYDGSLYGLGNFQYVRPYYDVLHGSIVVASQNTATMFDWIVSNAPSIAPDNDPYKEGGTSETGGGTGNFDGTSDPIDFPDMPTLSAVDTGFITLFKPTVADLQALANFMWNDLDLDNFTRLFNNIMDVILGISIVPVTPASGGVKQVSIGNVIATYIQMDTVASQYVEVDCGTLNVNEYWGAYLDYDPYTKAEIYLPYIGFRALKTDDIMNKAVHVKYHVDVLSGACCAYVKCGGSVIYQFIGQCAASIPITGGDWTNIINGILQMATAIGATIATHGAAAPFVAGQAINGVTTMNKPEIERSGGISGTGGMLGVQKPFIVLTRPRQCLPARQNDIQGYPSLITAQLGSLSGYTEVEKIELFDIGATREEYAEIEMLLAEGVIL